MGKSNSMTQNGIVRRDVNQLLHWKSTLCLLLSEIYIYTLIVLDSGHIAQIDFIRESLFWGAIPRIALHIETKINKYKSRLSQARGQESERIVGDGSIAVVSFCSAAAAAAADVAEVVQNELPNCNVPREMKVYAITLQAISIGSHHLFAFNDRLVQLKGHRLLVAPLYLCLYDIGRDKAKEKKLAHLPFDRWGSHA